MRGRGWRAIEHKVEEGTVGGSHLEEIVQCGDVLLSFRPGRRRTITAETKAFRVPGPLYESENAIAGLLVIFRRDADFPEESVRIFLSRAQDLGEVFNEVGLRPLGLA